MGGACLTYVTQAEFDALPNYELSEPTFGKSWLEPGRYWKYRSWRGWKDESNNERLWNPWQIGCFVTAGFNEKGEPMVAAMYDWLEVREAA